MNKDDTYFAILAVLILTTATFFFSYMWLIIDGHQFLYDGIIDERRLTATKKHLTIGFVVSALLLIICYKLFYSKHKNNNDEN